MDLYGWLVVGHVVAVVLAFAAHGVAAFAMFKVRGERDRTRLAAILDMSSGSFMTALVGLLAAIVPWIAAAIVCGHFARLWPWAAIIVLVLATGSMTRLAAMPMNRVRIALGMAIVSDKPASPPREAGSDEELATALAGIHPELPAAIGVAGIAILVWLMRARPFQRPGVAPGPGCWDSTRGDLAGASGRRPASAGTAIRSGHPAARTAGRQPKARPRQKRCSTSPSEDLRRSRADFAMVPSGSRP